MPAASMPEFASAQALQQFIRIRTGAEERRNCVATGRVEQPVPSKPRGVQPPDSSLAAVVTGVVTRVGGVPVQSASVFINELTIGSLTKADGSFSFSIPATKLLGRDSITLTARLVGLSSVSRRLALRPGGLEIARFSLCFSPIRLGEVSIGDFHGTLTDLDEYFAEGGEISQVVGGRLYVLQRGRLFAFRITAGAPVLVRSMSAFAPGMRVEGEVYSKILIHGDRLYIASEGGRRGPSLAVFDIGGSHAPRYLATYRLSPAGAWSFGTTFEIRGDHLVHYSVFSKGWHEDDALASIQNLILAKSGSADPRDVAITTERHSYHSMRSWGPPEDATIHVLTSCDLSAPEFACRSTVVAAPWPASVQLTVDAEYVWTEGPHLATRGSPTAGVWDSTPAELIRIPLDGAPPSSVSIPGSPITSSPIRFDDRGSLELFMMRDTMPGVSSELYYPRARGNNEMLRIPLTAFGDGSGAAPTTDYWPLRDGTSERIAAVVGGDTMYHALRPGYAEGEAESAGVSARALKHLGTESPGAWLSLTHPPDRLEMMGGDIVATGFRGRAGALSTIRRGTMSGATLRFSLDSSTGAAEHSARSFYLPLGPDSGLIALSVRGAIGERPARWVEGRAAIIFIRKVRGSLTLLGRVQSHLDSATATPCSISCTDWYSDSRAILANGRILVILGYELVEVDLRHGRLRELSRQNFEPPSER